MWKNGAAVGRSHTSIPITMTFPAIIAALSLPMTQDATPFTQPQGVAEPSRLAITPVLDGLVSPDEWDGFAKSNDGETFLQWEPRKLYVAGKIPADRDLVLSIDSKQNGWLVGNDNLEVRFRLVDGKVTVTARQLDATNVNGPKWIAQPILERAAIVNGKVHDGITHIEAALVDPGSGLLPTTENEKFSARLDVIAQSAQATEPFYPRVGTPLRLAEERASAMPVGLNWNVEQPGRSLTPGTASKIRFTFNSKENPNLKKIEIKPIGPLADHATVLGQPFPAFDKKGRAMVDYEARAGKEAPTGYHLVATTLTTSDGIPAMIQASVRIAPLVDFVLTDAKIELKAGVQEIKIPFYIKSNSNYRLDGDCDVQTPQNWEILKGDEKDFTIYNGKSGVRRVLTVRIPADTAGTVPMKFKATIGTRVVEDVRWLTVSRK